MTKTGSALPPWPLELVIHRAQGRLEIAFDDGLRFDIPAPLLRALTPSAAERGHGARSEAPLPFDFSNVSLRSAEPVGAYAVRLIFDDGHDSGIYTWEALYRFGRDAQALLMAHRRAVSENRTV